MSRRVETLDGYLTKLASADPVPGGGSAAMVSGALACALVSMVARICLNSTKYEPVHAPARALVEAADSLRGRMSELRAHDEQAFLAVVAAKGDKDAMQQALQGAAAAPLEGAGAAVEALRLAHRALGLNNSHLASDTGCASEFAYAALTACAYNVRVNHTFMKDERVVAAQQAELERLEREALSFKDAIGQTVRMALTPPDQETV